jgi:hypothetical protein
MLCTVATSTLTNAQVVWCPVSYTCGVLFQVVYHTHPTVRLNGVLVVSSGTSHSESLR